MMQPSPPAEVEAALSQLRAACAHWPIGDGSGAFYVAQNGASPGVACLAASDDFVPHVAVTAASFATVFLLFVIVLTVLADRWIARRKMLDAGIAFAVFCLVMLASAAAAASLWGGSTTIFVAWLLENPSSGGLQLFLIFAIGGAVFFWLAWRCCNRIGDLVTGLGRLLSRSLAGSGERDGFRNIGAGARLMGQEARRCSQSQTIRLPGTVRFLRPGRYGALRGQIVMMDTPAAPNPNLSARDAAAKP